MRAIVTGGAGFIGSHLSERLLSESHEVLVIDSLASGDSRVIFLQQKDIPLEQVDILRDEAIKAIKTFRPDVVFHLAAQMDVRVSMSDPGYDADVNVIGTLKMLGAASDVGARFINTSSGGAMYGELSDESNGLAETTPPMPISPYGISKVAAQMYCEFFHQFRGLPFVSLALGNVYGPRQDPHGEAGVVAIFVKKMMGGEPCVIYGDGKQTRDYVYVDDVVDAYLLAMQEGTGEVVNIGTGVETSVVSLHAELSRILELEKKPAFEPERPGELRRSALNIEKAKRVLGWAPKTPLPQGLHRMRDSYLTS